MEHRQCFLHYCLHLSQVSLQMINKNAHVAKHKSWNTPSWNVHGRRSANMRVLLRGSCFVFNSAVWGLPSSLRWKPLLYINNELPFLRSTLGSLRSMAAKLSVTWHRSHVCDVIYLIHPVLPETQSQLGLNHSSRANCVIALSHWAEGNSRDCLYGRNAKLRHFSEASWLWAVRDCLWS